VYQNSCLPLGNHDELAGLETSATPCLKPSQILDGVAFQDTVAKYMAAIELFSQPATPELS
jgi:hypothetical protein